MSARLLRSATATLLIGLLGLGCGESAGLTAPAAAPPAAAPSADLLGLGGLLGGVTRLLCPTPQGASATAVVGPEGGTLAAGGVRVDFPAGAVPDSQTFALQVVPGSYVDVQLSAQGSAHYTFATPVQVTLDLRRCLLLPVGLHAWYVDDNSHALVQDMGGVLDLLGGTFRFSTPHFSGYTVAW